jgi:hypothetical protein
MVEIYKSKKYPKVHFVKLIGEITDAQALIDYNYIKKNLLKTKNIISIYFFTESATVIEKSAILTKSRATKLISKNIKEGASIGMKGVQKIFFRMYTELTNRDFPVRLFDTVEEAEKYFNIRLDAFEVTVQSDK